MVSDNKYYVGSTGLQALIDKIAELKKKTSQEIQDEICKEHEPIHAQLDDHEARIGAAEGRLDAIEQKNEEQDANLQAHVEANDKKFSELDAKDAELVAKDTALEAKDAEQDETTAALRSEFDALKAIAVTYSDVATDDTPGRRAITLNNHDTILGKATNGAAYNLVMLSKWDKADFGSASIALNLNGSAARPTYNDAKEIALLEDVESSNAALEAYKISNDARVKAVEDGLAAVPGEIDARIQEVVGAAPDALDTLKELADALGNDADFAATVTNKFAQRDAKDAEQDKALESYRLEANGRLEAIEAKNNEQDGRLTAVEGDVAAYKTSNDQKVAALEAKDTTQDKALEEYKTSNDARVQAIEEANTTQDGATAALRSEFDTLKSDYEAVKADYEAVKADYEAVKADYEAYKTANDDKIAKIIEALNNLVTEEQVNELFADLLA